MASIAAVRTAAPTVLPPLVEPAAELTPAEVERYSRHLIIPEIGAVGQRRLKNARVLVIGAGGLGSPALLYLAAAGVGTLGIVDDDNVDLSNLQRQVIHGVKDVGTPKIESARNAIAELNPLVDVVLHNVRLDSSNALDLFAQYDLILDGADNFATRYLVNDAAAILGFDSLKEIFQKEILSLRAKGSGNFEGTIKNRIQRRQRRRFKITAAARPDQLYPERTL